MAVVVIAVAVLWEAVVYSQMRRSASFHSMECSAWAGDFGSGGTINSCSNTPGAIKEIPGQSNRHEECQCHEGSIQPRHDTKHGQRAPNPTSRIEIPADRTLPTVTITPPPLDLPYPARPLKTHHPKGSLYQHCAFFQSRSQSKNTSCVTILVFFFRVSAYRPNHSPTSTSAPIR